MEGLDLKQAILNKHTKTRIRLHLYSLSLTKQARSDKILQIISELTRQGWQRKKEGKIFLLWLFTQSIGTHNPYAPNFFALALFFARENNLEQTKHYWSKALSLDPEYSRQELWKVTSQLIQNLADKKDQSPVLKILLKLLAN